MVKVAQYLLEESGRNTESLDGYETSQWHVEKIF